MNAQIVAMIRVAVAAGVGALVSLFAKWGLHLPAGWVATVGVAITGLVTTFYLHTLTALEKRFPWLGWFLGVKAKTPSRPRSPSRA